MNANAAEAISGSRAVSLLMVGVTAVDGDFEEGDIIAVRAPGGSEIAIGRTAYSARQARQMIGAHDVKPIVHYDYLVGINE